MSYNTKYILKYCNAKGNKLRIELQLWDYVGTQFLLVNDSYVLDDEDRMVIVNKDGNYIYDRDTNRIEGASNPFSLTFHNDTGEKGGAIRALEANMEFYEDALFNIDDLATSDETEIRAIFYYDDNIEFIGFVTPDFFNVEITENPIIQLTASDRLGVLKDVSYPLMSNITENIRLIKIIANCLQLTGLGLSINVVCGMYSDDFPDYGIVEGYEQYELTNAFHDTWVNEHRLVKNMETFETMDAYNVLQSIMNQFNCLLTQKNGEWWIVNKFDQQKGGGIKYTFDMNGDIYNYERIVFDELHFGMIDKGGERTLIPANAKNTLVLDNGENIIYPLNNKIKLYSPSSIFPDFWVNNGMSYELTDQYPTKYNSLGDVSETYTSSEESILIKSYAQEDPGENDFVRLPWNSPNMESHRFKMPSVYEFKFDLKLTIEAIGRPRTGLFIALCIYFPKDDMIFWTPQFHDYEFLFGGYSIITGQNISEPISRYEFEDKYKDENIAVEQTFNVDKSISFSYFKEKGIFYKGSFNSTSLNDALMYVKVFRNFSRSSKKAHSLIKSIKVDFLNDSQIPEGTVYQSKLTGKFTHPANKITVLFGDQQNVGQNGYFYKYREDALSIQYNQWGSKLKNWFTPYDTERNPQLIHALRQLTYSYGKAHDELRIGFDIARIDPLAHYAVRCISNKKVLVNPEDDILTDTQSKYITASIGKYLNNKRFVLVEGTIDYLRSHFEGILAQIRTDEIQHEEYIYSYFEQGDIN